jgi:serine/threonine protein kinase
MAGTDSSSSLLERLRVLLAPDYSVERELARGGMGIVFLGHDVALDRPVAIKVLKPEMATAELAARFLREARVLAKLSHPNIVPVYRVGEGLGLYYYIMEFLGGETLHKRLTQRRLRTSETITLGLDLLAAIGAAHKHKWVHRDIKPGNVFLTDDRAILTDFGVAKPLGGTDTTLTGTEQLIGTLAYMAPEQLAGEPATELSDIYAAGISLYESLTGRRWWSRSPGEPTDWSGIPRRLLRVLRKALSPLPGDRWRDAATFRRQLVLAGTARRLTPVLVGTVVLIPLIVLVTRGSGRHQPPSPATSEPIAVEAFSGVGMDSMLPLNLTELVRTKIEGVSGVSVLSPHSAQEASESLRGRLTLQAGVVELRLSLVKDSAELWSLAVHGSPDSLVQLSNDAASRIIVQLVPHLHGFVPGQGFSQNPQAIREFVAGDIAFRSIRWEEAENRFRFAIALDSNFALAHWRLANVLRWRRLSQEESLLPLYQRFGSSMRELDRLLIAAQIEPDLKLRFDKYQEAVDKYPTDGYAALFYGDELFHRGPLVGEPLSHAVALLEAAITNDSTLAPAWFHIGWAYTRLGDSTQAERALDHQTRLEPSGTSSDDIDPTLFLTLARNERFLSPGDAARALSQARMTPKQLGGLIRVFRWALSFDIPEAQLAYGKLIGKAVPAPLVRASAHSGQGIALVALGRPMEALAQFDSAADLRDTPEADFHRAEWRVLPAALGLYTVDSARIAEGRLLLRAHTGPDRLAARAAWALALDARSRSDLVELNRYRAVVTQLARGDSAVERLRVFLEAEELGANKQYDSALAISLPLLSTDSAGRFGDPFARALLHLRRGEWWEKLGRPIDADREWMWYEHSDLAGDPTGDVQPVEVDWALGPIAKGRRAELGFTTGHVIESCAHARRVRELWSHPEPAVGAQLKTLGQLMANCPA